MIKYLCLHIMFLCFCINVFAQPANNDCTSPQVLTDLDNGCVTISNTGATPDSYIGGCMDDNNNVWYSFTAQGPTTTISANIPVNNANPEFFVSYSPTGDPCTLADAVGVACFTQTGNNQTISGTVNNLVVGETYYIQVTSNNTGNLTLCINNPVAAPVELCDNITPFCSDSPVTFPAETNTTATSGPAYGCLFSQPNPAWFYLEIEDPGNIEITLTSNPNVDIDFIVWGPFSSINDGCQGGISVGVNIEDCSFSGATSEIVEIANAQTGEIYILMITNFSNDPTDITAVQTDGTGTTNCGIVLPVELGSLQAKPEQKHNLVTWTTASETNNDYFILESSSDGENFKSIGTIAGNGNSSQNINYQFNDFEYFSPKTFYRLIQVDYDGEQHKSQVIVVNRQNDLNDMDIILYPNPSTGEVNLKTYLENSGEVNIKVMNLLGELIYNEKINFKVGYNNHTFDFSNLANGIYAIEFQNQYSRKVMQFVKQ